MKKWSNVVLSIWIIFFSIMLSGFFLTKQIPVAYLLALLLTAFIFFLLTMFEMMKKK